MTPFLVALLFLPSQLDRAQDLLRAGKVEEAQLAVEAALAENPKSVSALLLHGRLAMAQSRFDAARISFRRAVELAPESAAAQFLLGFFHYVDNDFVEALPVLERARKLAPGDARAVLFLALTYEGLAKPEKAERLFQEALRMEAKSRRPSAETHVAYARMLFANGRLKDAQAQVAHALAVDPNSREALYERARIHFEEGRFKECVSDAERSLTLTGEGTTPRQIHFLLSRAYARLGDAARSAKHRREFEAIPPRLIR